MSGRSPISRIHFEIKKETSTRKKRNHWNRKYIKITKRTSKSWKTNRIRAAWAGYALFSEDNLTFLTKLLHSSTQLRILNVEGNNRTNFSIHLPLALLCYDLWACIGERPNLAADIGHIWGFLDVKLSDRKAASLLVSQQNSGNFISSKKDPRFDKHKL